MSTRQKGKPAKGKGKRGRTVRKKGEEGYAPKPKSPKRLRANVQGKKAIRKLQQKNAISCVGINCRSKNTPNRECGGCGNGLHDVCNYAEQVSPDRIPAGIIVYACGEECLRKALKKM